jgi:hypothetical protein
MIIRDSLQLQLSIITLVLSLTVLLFSPDASANTKFLKGSYAPEALRGTGDCGHLTLSSFDVRSDQHMVASWLLTGQEIIGGSIAIYMARGVVTTKFDGKWIDHASASSSVFGKNLHVDIEIVNLASTCDLTFILKDILDVKIPTLSKSFIPGEFDPAQVRADGACRDMRFGTFTLDKSSLLGIWFIPVGRGAIEVVNTVDGLKGQITGPDVRSSVADIKQIGKNLHVDFAVSHKEGDCSLSFVGENIF